MVSKKWAPVIIFAYNRYDLLVKSLESLSKCEGSEITRLFIFVDGPRNKKDEVIIRQIIEYCNSIKGFKNITIKIREQNLGLAKSIINGVSEVFMLYDNAIILEDDLLFSTNFLSYMNESLLFYENNLLIYSIAGYSYNFKINNDYKYDVYFHLRNSSWGWATWKNRWEACNWSDDYYGNLLNDKDFVKNLNSHCSDLPKMLKKFVAKEINSWSIRWTCFQFKNNGYTVYPTISKVKNIKCTP